MNFLSLNASAFCTGLELFKNLGFATKTQLDILPGEWPFSLGLNCVLYARGCLGNKQIYML